MNLDSAWKTTVVIRCTSLNWREGTNEEEGIPRDYV
jgi:hypothetical protein